MTAHLNIKVIGKVQGVWFRAATQEKAIALGLSGFVKNENDGSVYLEAEGEKEKLDELVKWCHIGPPKASVKKVEVKQGEMKNFKKFVIANT